jgi:RNA polymerase sigma factor (sigma-70 family)
MLPNETEAEDAFQATFLALIQSARRVRTPAVGAWLHGVAVRIARMAKRSAGRRRRRELGAAAREASAPVAAGAWDELQAAVHEEVGRLPEALRAAFVLCGLQGRSQRDVAAELGWKPGTLSGRLAKARQQLLERLSKRGVTAGGVVAAVVGGSAAGTAGTPAALVAKVLALAQGGIGVGNVASPALLELARKATEVTMTRMKLLCLTFALAGCAAVGVTFMPAGNAQDKAPAGGPGVGSPDTGGGAPGKGRSVASDRGVTTAGAWEYKYVARKSDRLDDFRKVLASHSAENWEYVGSETLQVDDGSASGPVLVFKRPRVAAGAGMTGFAPAGGMGGMSMGSGFGGQGLGGGGAFGGKPGGGPNPKETPKLPGANDPAGGTKAGIFDRGSGSATAPKRDVLVFALKHASAASLTKSLQELFNDPTTRIAFDQQTNTLFVQTDAGTYELIKKILDRLDVPPATRAGNR